MPITYQTAEDQLAGWLAAESQLMLGQAVSHQGRTLTRADLAAVGERIAYWDQQARRLAPPGTVIPERRSQLQHVVVTS